MCLNDYQIKALEEMKDSRAISPKLLKEFADEKGALNVFLLFAQNHEDLNICFRGNNNAIEIYYLNHLIWKIKPGRHGRYKVSFNFGHAKKMNNKNEHLSYFEDNGFKMADDGKTIYFEKKYFTEKDITEELWKHFKEIMDFYFNPLKGAPNIEKRWQHKFFRDFHNEKNLFHGLYVYDLEYHQRLPHKDELLKIFGKKTDEELFQMGVHSKTMKKTLASVTNEPDFMGIEFDEKLGEAFLVFGEIKSLYRTCEGTSGIDQHLKNMKSYFNFDILIKKRKDEAEEILKQYVVIGDIRGKYRLEGLSNKLKIKNVLVLTNSRYKNEEKDFIVDWDTQGGAIKFFKDNHDDLIKKAAEAKCEIWLVEDACCDDDYPITMDDIKKVTYTMKNIEE